METNRIISSPDHLPYWLYAAELDNNPHYIHHESRILHSTLSGYSMILHIHKQDNLRKVNEFQTDYGQNLIKLLREAVGKWRIKQYPSTTKPTRNLLFNQFYILSAILHHQQIPTGTGYHQ